jgi:trimethylamine---corrinoid protein Co-methyltransferase
MNTAHRPILHVLDPGEPALIVEEAIAVLETVGVRVDSGAGRALLLDARAEAAGDRIRIPERLVRDALVTAPHGIHLFDREGGPAADLSGDAVHFDPGSAAIHVLDSMTGRRREALTADVVALVRLVDGLANYAVQSTALLAADVPPEVADGYRLYLALRHGRKPVVTGTFRADGFGPMREMLEAARGGGTRLAERPLAVFDCCPSPPLAWSDLTCRALLDCARAGIPANLISMPLAGATAPVTLRDSVVQHAAESLSGLVLHQLAGPGSPISWGGAPAAFDMRHSTTPMGSMETMLLNLGNAQVGKSLGLPVHGYLALSDAKGPDYQAGMETGMGAVLAALAGINLVSGPGILDYILTQSPVKLVLDHEACGMALRLTRGLARRPGETLSLFHELVRTGEFLSHPHTRAHWKEELTVPSAVIDRDTWADWEAKGAKDAAARAGEELARRMSGEAGSPAPEALAAELDHIMLAGLTRHGMTELPAAARG